MEQVDRIMPVGSLIPWIPRLNTTDDNMASYLPAKGWIKCDGIETCDRGIFEGQSCPSMAGRGLIGADEELKPSELHDASIPQHNHDHTHEMNSHSHYSKNSKGANPGSVTKVSACTSGSYCSRRSDVAGFHDHTTREQTQSVTSSMQTHSAPVTSVSGANIGENLPAHMRVDYLFKCY